MLFIMKPPLFSLRGKETWDGKQNKNLKNKDHLSVLSRLCLDCLLNLCPRSYYTTRIVGDVPSVSVP